MDVKVDLKNSLSEVDTLVCLAATQTKYTEREKDQFYQDYSG